MTVSGVGGANAMIGQPGMIKDDPVSKGIKEEIANAQKQLQEISANKELSAEDKMKKRQELQQKISELNIQLRQHQIEQRKEKQQSKETSNDMSGTDKQTGTHESNQKGAGLSQVSMEAMISADTSMKQAKVQGDVAERMHGKAGVLEAEIKLDGSRGGNVGSKEAELAKVNQTAEKAEASQLNTLVEAEKRLSEAAETEQDTQKTKEEDKKNKLSAEDETGDEDKTAGTKGNEDTETGAVSNYTPVDVRL